MKTNTIKSSKRLLEIISEEIDALRANRSTAQRSNALCNLAGKHIAVIRQEIEITKLLGGKPAQAITLLTNGSRQKD